MKLIYILLFFIALTPLYGVAQGVSLESNLEYVELLESEKELKLQEDSISKKVAVVLAKFKKNVENRAKYSAHMVKLEESLFDVRSKLGLILSEISSIEQAFILDNQNSDDSPALDVISDEKYIFLCNENVLTENSVFMQNLSKSDYITLNKAQAKELSIVGYIEMYNANYDSITEIKRAYRVEESIIAADSLYEKYMVLRDANKNISEAIFNTWKTIYDNKGYYYNLLLDKLNKVEEIEKFGAKQVVVMQSKAGLMGQYESDVIPVYFLEKKMMLENEIEISNMFGLDAAKDSLSRAMKQHNSLNYKLAKIKIKEREFVDYDSIEIHKPSKYTRSNPMLSYEVPIRGTLYKLLVGSYKVKQSPSIFRGAYPVSYIKGSDHKYNYYIGSFRSIDEAVGSVKLLKSIGFRNPIIVGWVDGVKYDVDMEAEMGRDGYAYSVKVGFAGDLPEEVAELIKVSTINKDISRINESYTIGLFSSEVSAARLSRRIKELMPELNVTISEVKL